jgi:hypothetical protein
MARWKFRKPGGSSASLQARKPARYSLQRHVIQPLARAMIRPGKKGPLTLTRIMRYRIIVLLRDVPAIEIDARSFRAPYSVFLVVACIFYLYGVSREVAG